MRLHLDETFNVAVPSSLSSELPDTVGIVIKLLSREIRTERIPVEGELSMEL